ncbi:MAG: transcriptional regulator [Verrucomicrobiaceae bacterium]|nr:transcriptional regulator [Verrucomicrobiaceae bacterium]
MDRERHRLLVIDDDDAVRDSMAEYLQELGYQVEQAASGRRGLELFEQNPPEVVLLDLKLPQMGGLEVLKALNQHPANIPIIVISGSGVMNDVVQALRYGASDYLVKPITDMEMLTHAVSRGIEQNRLRRENQLYSEQLEAANRDLRQSLNALQQDQQAGRHVQLKMFPARPLTIGDYHLSHRIFPSLFLSGDFVDYFTVGDSKAVFFIADVSGHGASSAFLTVLMKNLFARKRSDFGHWMDRTILSPAAMLAQANRELLATEVGKHVTLCVAVMDIRDNTLLYSIAGHLPAPILWSPTGCHYLKGDNPPVGLFEDAEYTEERLDLPNEFALSLFSDGILETIEVDGLLAKEKALLATLAEGFSSMDALIDALGLQGVKEAPDDIAVLLVSKG